MEIKTGENFLLNIPNISEETVQIKMIWIPPGHFTMGCPETEKYYIEGVNHQFTVIHTRGYWLSQHMITNAQWQAIINDSSDHKTSENDLPIVNVSWSEATDYCRQLQRKLQLSKQSYHLRLPTEAEWEYAVVLGKQNLIHGTDLDAYEWHRNNTDKLMPVGLKAPNSLGLYDLQGNASEWCYDSGGYFRPHGSIKDYFSRYDEKRHIRSGSYAHDLGMYEFSQCVGDSSTQSTKLPYLGFRLCFGIVHSTS
jgi:formylglycine-generating enzyme required for sulfatase activity